MSLKRDLVKRFQALHHEKYNENIKYEVAELRLKELAQLIRIVAPISKDLNHG